MVEESRRETWVHIAALIQAACAMDRAFTCHCPLADGAAAEVAEPAAKAVAGLARTQALQAAYYALRDGLIGELPRRQ
jgi:hypothetical protein